VDTAHSQREKHSVMDEDEEYSSLRVSCMFVVMGVGCVPEWCYLIIIIFNALLSFTLLVFGILSVF
jgi:hypothetical protein